MFKRSLESFLSLTAVALLFLTVSCSHTKRASSQLEGLSAEASVAEESATQTDAKNVEEAPAAADVAVNASAPEAKVEEAASKEDMVVAKTDADFSVPTTDDTSAVSSTNSSTTLSSSSSSDLSNNVSQDLGSVGDSAPVVSSPVADSSSVANTSPAATGTTLFDSEVKREPASNSPRSNSLNSSPNQDSSRRKKRGPKKAKDNTAEAVVPDANAVANAAPEKDPAQEKELASADLNSLIERNLLWFAFAIVGGVIAVFFTVRRSRRSNDHHMP